MRGSARAIGSRYLDVGIGGRVEHQDRRRDNRSYVHEPLAMNSTVPKSTVAIASASDPPSASQVAGPITNDRVPNPPYSTVKAITRPVLALA